MLNCGSKSMMKFMLIELLLN